MPGREGVDHADQRGPVVPDQRPLVAERHELKAGPDVGLQRLNVRFEGRMVQGDDRMMRRARPRRAAYGRDGKRDE